MNNNSPGRVTTLAAIKGGTGKTTTAAALIHAGADDGRRVLAIDMDPQANLSYLLKASTAPGMTVFDVLQYGADARQCLQTVAPGIDVLAASTDLLIPVTTDTGALQGMYKIIETAQEVQEATGHSLNLAGIVITNYDGRPKINRFLVDAIKDAADAAGIPFLSAIRRGCAIPEAAAFQTSLFDYAPKSKQAADYSELYREVIK